MRWASGRRAAPSPPPTAALGVLALGLFVLGIVGGYTFAVDRQLQGGILRQRREAASRPDWVELRQLPAYVPEAFLAVVEPELLARSGMRPTPNGPSLAGELIRQIHLLPDNIIGESRERLMAPVLERRLSETQLLELYLNRVYLGEQHGYPIFGIYHAAREYFGKSPGDLTLGEAATLAGLLLEPRIEDPQSRVGAVGARRNEVLEVLRLAELISEEEFREALAEPLGFQPGLEQMPMTRPSDWGRGPDTIRLPPAWRPSPADSTESQS